MEEEEAKIKDLTTIFSRWGSAHGAA